MSRHFNNLLPGEAERLAILAEECAETIAVIGKILRHGWAPTDVSVTPHVAYDNRLDLARECGDVRAAMIRLCNAGDLDKDLIHARANVKLVDRARLHHQEEKNRG